jgi:dihydrofolate reductase
MAERVPSNRSDRRCVLWMVVSVDGYTSGPGGEFIPPAWSADLDAWAAQCAARFDTLLFGRVAWQGMADYWQMAENDSTSSTATRDMAQFMNSTQKVVFSRTLVSAEAWRNSEIAKGDPSVVISKLKRKLGKEIGLLASTRLAQTVLAAGVVDELALLVIPELFGHGSRLFEGHALRRNLQLIETITMNTGAVQMRYHVSNP